MESEYSAINERHLLVFNYKKSRYIELKSNIFTLGRDPSKNIRIKSNLISREHATFLRIPTPKINRYEYRIIDGGPNSSSSANGIFVNARRTYIHLLKHCDVISFSNTYEAIYLKVELSEKLLEQYLAILATVKKFDERNRNNIATLTRIFCKAQSPIHLSQLTSSLLA